GRAVGDAESRGRPPLAGWAARALGDAEAWDELTDRWVRVVRACGALAVLPIALDERSRFELATGDHTTAQALAAEARAAIEANRRASDPPSPVPLAAWTQTHPLHSVARWDPARGAAP